FSKQSLRSRPLKTGPEIEFVNDFMQLRRRLQDCSREFLTWTTPRRGVFFEFLHAEATFPKRKKTFASPRIGTRIGQQRGAVRNRISRGSRFLEVLCTFWSRPIPCPGLGPIPANWSPAW